MIRNKDLECLHSVMVECTKDNGKMVSNMVEVYSVRKMYQDKECGRMENVLDGWMKNRTLHQGK